MSAAVGWPCAGHVHVHGAPRGTPVPHVSGGCENAGMAGKGARGRGRAPIGCARVHANDASVGLFRVYNSSCVTVCMIVSLVSLILSYSSSRARDWNRFQAVLDESPPPDLAVGPWGLLQRPGAGTRRQRCPSTLPSQNLDGPRPGMCRHVLESTRRGQWSRSVSCDRRRLSPAGKRPDAFVTSVVRHKCTTGIMQRCLHVPTHASHDSSVLSLLVQPRVPLNVPRGASSTVPSLLRVGTLANVS